MAPSAQVRPNRRGMKSRERVLDAAERVMAERGFEAATIGRIVEESGIPLSSVYHYFGSKDGVLLAVMERGAHRFFTDLPRAEGPARSPEEQLRQVVAATVQTLARHPSFLRLLIVFAVQPPRTGSGEIRAVVGELREHALRRLRRQLAIALGDDPRNRRIDRLARFALASIDGAFVASQTDPGSTLQGLLEPLPGALVAGHRRLVGQNRPTAVG